jgi:predicted ribosome quality control (RQC) complex YloA/Tae2 family protein
LISHNIAYRIWSESIYSRFGGCELIQAISFSKDALFLVFSKDENLSGMECKFVKNELVLLFHDKASISSVQKQHVQNQFKELSGETLNDVQFKLLDRIIILHFSNDQYLVLKGFGKYGNLLTFQSTDLLKPENIFRLHLKKDWDFNLQPFLDFNYSLKLGTIQKSELIGDENTWNFHFKSTRMFELFQENEIINFFSETNLNVQNEILVEKVLSIETIEIEHDGFGLLNFVFNKNAKIEGVKFEQIELELSQKLKDHLRWFYFSEQKELEIAKQKQTIQNNTSKRTQYTNRLNIVNTQRSMKELGDILMSNAHSVSSGLTEALLFDFYNNQRLRIKLNPKLNCSENAEWYYKKAKNQMIEVGKLTEHIEDCENKITQASALLGRIIKTESMMELKPLIQSNGGSKSPIGLVKKTTESPIESKFKKEIESGFEIWIGKNGKNNDELLRFSHKNDIWMHAKDCAGSHVIVRANNKSIPDDVLKKAASHAALNSKAKTQSIATVMFTERKYVSKPKGAAPGEVKVNKFSILDVILAH